MSKFSTCRTGKVQYRDWIAAMNALAKIQHQDKPMSHQKAAYKCPVCKKYHLTSQE